MKIDHTNIYEYTKDNGTVYYASFNGVMMGTVVENVRNEERDSYLIVGTSMAIPINEHPNNNTQFSSGGYFSTYDEAVQHFRSLLVAYIKRVNASTLSNDPILLRDVGGTWTDQEEYNPSFSEE